MLVEDSCSISLLFVTPTTCGRVTLMLFQISRCSPLSIIDFPCSLTCKSRSDEYHVKHVSRTPAARSKPMDSAAYPDVAAAQNASINRAESCAPTFITFSRTRGNFISAKIISLPHCDIGGTF